MSEVDGGGVGHAPNIVEAEGEDKGGVESGGADEARVVRWRGAGSVKTVKGA